MENENRCSDIKSLMKCLNRFVKNHGNRGIIVHNLSRPDSEYFKSADVLAYTFIEGDRICLNHLVHVLLKEEEK